MSDDARKALAQAGLNDDFQAQTFGPLDKPSNPKDIIGSDKLPLHLWPASATAMGAIGLLEGATKYGRANWRAAGVRSSIYVDACMRHLAAWMEGEEVAPDSGVPHLANALACLAIIVDAQAAGKLNDDRNYSGGGYRKLVEELTHQVARIKKMNSERTPKHWTIADKAPGTFIETDKVDMFRPDMRQVQNELRRQDEAMKKKQVPPLNPMYKDWRG